jgi:hypothetical protein
MLIVFWSTMGRLVEQWLPEVATFNTTPFCKGIIPRLTSAVFPDQAAWRKQRVYLHVDNARRPHSKRSVQCINNSKLKRIPYRLYWPYIAPSDSYLFGNVKQRLQTCEGRPFEDLQDSVHEILGYIGLIELAATIRAWIERLQRVIDANREYV